MKTQLIPVPGVENATYCRSKTARHIYVCGQVVPLATLTENTGTYAIGFQRELHTLEVAIVCDAIRALVIEDGEKIAAKVQAKGGES